MKVTGMKIPLCGVCNGEGFLDEEVCESCNGEGVIVEDTGRDGEGVGSKRRRPLLEGDESPEAQRVRTTRLARKRLGQRRKAERATRNRKRDPEREI